MLAEFTEVDEATRPRKKRLRREPLTTLPGLIREAGRVYRQMRNGTLHHDKGRSLIWSLSQIRPMLEAQMLERIEARLELLNAAAEANYSSPTISLPPPARLPNQ